MYSNFRRSKWLQILIPLAATSLILTLLNTLLSQLTAPIPLVLPQANTTIAAASTPSYVSINGLLGSYYTNQNLTGEPEIIHVDSDFDQLWDNSQPTLAQLSPPFSVRWQGSIRPSFSERYRFITTSDDGIRLWIDDQLLIDNWSVHAATTDQAEIELKADYLHKITIEFFDRGYEGVMKLEWESAQQKREVIPASQLFYKAAQERIVSGQAIRPIPIPISSPEIVNPLRGLYRWMGNELVPSPNPLPRPSFDSYERYEWRSLEPKLNQYDFTAIENDLQRAAREGRKHAFRVRVLVSGQASSVPDYMRPLMERGWSHTFDGDSNPTYIPDWNDPDFLQRVERLIKALGERYDQDPRVSYIDIGIFGIWGEWHTYQLNYPSATGARTMTRENRQKLIDFHIAAFPSKRLLMMSDDEQSLLYALKQSPRIGWRRDSLGDDHFDKPSKNANLWAIARDRWKTAPVVTELINPRGHSDPESYALARDQVVRYHVSMISNGNAIKWNVLSAQGRQMLIEAAKHSGYRYRPQEIYFPSTLKPTANFTIASTWLNEGVAPAYEPWAIIWQLRSPSGVIVWQEESSLDLQLLLPTTDSDRTSGTSGDESLPHFKHEDQITLPANLTPGTYQLQLLVRDPQGYRAPMSLAIQGRQPDGSYNLKTITIVP